MVDLPKKKVGIVACSGEEMAEGTVTRLAALKVLEQYRPGDTVTICLPLFLAGGEGDRAFARFYPTIALDGCEKRCAARATEKYSGKPAASLVVTDILAEQGLEKPAGARRLNQAGLQAVEISAQRAAGLVDDLLEKHWNRHAGAFAEDGLQPEPQEPVVATCSCGSGIPVQKIQINGRMVELAGLPLIFQQSHEAGKPPTNAVVKDLFETVKIYNRVTAGEESAYEAALKREYEAFVEQQRSK